MSRIGRKPIAIPKGVTVKVHEGAIDVQGPKGRLTQALPGGIRFELADGHLIARRASEDPALAKYHGLARSLVANAVVGVTEHLAQAYLLERDEPVEQVADAAVTFCLAGLRGREG